MAKRIPGVEYIDVVTKQGQTLETLDAILYAPDGSNFKMPWGGNPLTYINKGYLTKPNADWMEKNKVYEELQAQSLKLSIFQRDIHNRGLEVQRQKVVNAQLDEMRQVEATMKIEEDRLKGIIAEPVDPIEVSVLPAKPAKALTPQEKAAITREKTKSDKLAQVANQD